MADDHDLRPLWEAVHARLCRGGVKPGTTITLRAVDPEVRRAVDRLMGRVSGPGPLKVRLDRLDAALARAGTDAERVAVAVLGAVVDQSALRADQAASAKLKRAAVLAHPVASEPAIATWLVELQATGRMARVGARRVLDALDVLEVLPHTGPTVGRTVLAAVVLGPEHALDDNTPLERLVTAGLAARAGVERPSTAAGRAELWAQAGVSFDAVSSPALTLGLRPRADGPLTQAAARWADGGVPLPIPFAAIAAERWRLSSGAVVFVCENPSVLEAAATEFGPTAPPVVCVSGVPGRAVSSLLTELADSGAELRYHGDFGTGGIAIANLIMARHGASPWRMAALDYRRAVAAVTGAGRLPALLRGRVRAASWDPDLADEIFGYGREITEEHVIDDLLDDLRRA